jgi:Tannase and feruloyl esterase
VERQSRSIGQRRVLRDQPPDLPPPVVRGYMTYGTDSGYQAKKLPEIQAFALNDEALANFAYASYKKTRDLALTVPSEFYGHNYYGGPPNEAASFACRDPGQDESSAPAK